MRVDFCSRWDNPFVLDYNRYYLQGLSAIAHLTSSTQPWYLMPLPDVANRTRAATALMRHVNARLGARYTSQAARYVGHYLLTDGDRRLRVAIDPHDNRRIASHAALDWADVYFKSNKWAAERYPSKVLPLVNGNGVHTRRTLAHLASLRRTPKTYDFVFVSRLASGVEHNLNVFESLAQLRCRKRIVAVLYAEFGHHQYEARLKAIGVECIRHNLRPADLWTLLAQSRVNFVRLGAKWCIPWRMIDLLCLGSSIVIDRHPFSDWPVPLREGVNFVSCFGRTDAPGDEHDYAIVRETVERMLGDDAHAREMSERNAAYFDEHAAPEPVGRYVVNAALAVDTSGGTSTTWGDAVAPWPEAEPVIATR